MHDELQNPHPMKAAYSLRAKIRELKGRPLGAFYCQVEYRDGRVYRGLPPTRFPDPVLDLFVARQSCRRSVANALHYGAVRQQAMSPVVLP